MPAQFVNPGKAPPKKSGQTAQEYFRELLRQGWLAAEAADAVVEQFGYPNQPPNPNDATKANIAATIGQTAGTLGSSYLIGTMLQDKKTVGTASEPSIKQNYGQPQQELPQPSRQVPTQGTSANTVESQNLQSQGIRAETGAAVEPTTPTTQTQPTNASAATEAATVAKPTTELPGGTTKVETPSGTREVPNEALNDPEFTNRVDWGRVGQGAIGAWQVYTAYQDWKKGDKGSAAVGAISGGTNIAAAAGSQTASSIAPYLASGMEVYKGATSQFNKNLSEKEKNYELAMTAPRAIAAYYTLGLSSLAEGLARKQWGGTMAKLDKFNQQWYGPMGGTMMALSAVGSSKKAPQLLRDKIRTGLQSQGFLDDKYQGTLADGSTFDFGKDGSYLKGKNLDKTAAENAEAWNAITNSAGALVAGYGLTGSKNRDVALWYQNAAVSNANNDPAIARANMRHFAEQQGLTYYDVKAKLDEGLANNQLSQSQYDSYLQGANDLFGEGPAVTVKPTAPTAPTPPIAQPQQVAPTVTSPTINKPPRILNITKKQQEDAAINQKNITPGVPQSEFQSLITKEQIRKLTKKLPK